GTAGFSGDGGPAGRAQLRNPSDIVVDRSGNMFIADSTNYRVRKIASGGVISTLAGNGNRGFSDGTATTAQFNLPMGAVVDAAGNLYITDRDNQRVRRLALDGTVSTIAGNGTAGS